MPRTIRGDDEDENNVCLGTGCIGQLREHAARGKRVRYAIGFVHFPDPEKPVRKPARARTSKRRRRRVSR